MRLQAILRRINQQALSQASFSVLGIYTDGFNNGNLPGPQLLCESHLSGSTRGDLLLYVRLPPNCLKLLCMNFTAIHVSTVIVLLPPRVPWQVFIIIIMSWLFFSPHSPSLELRPGLSPSLGLWTNVVTNKDFVLDIDTYICQCRLGHVQCTLICELKGAHWKSGKKAETFNPLLRYR